MTLAKEYYQYYVQYESTGYEEIFKKYDFTHSNILDIGCGVAATLFYLRKNYEINEAIGIDMSKESISIANQKNIFDNIKFIRADMFEVPLKQNHFDYIFSFGVLHYYPYGEVDKMMRLLSSVLNEKGKIILYLFKPNILHQIRRALQRLLIFLGVIKIFEKMDNLNRRNVIMNTINPPVFYIYTPEEFFSLATNSGLEIESVFEKRTHVLPHLLPFKESLNKKLSDLVLAIDIMGLLSLGNYYVLKKRSR